jgi:hypothetical protein
MPKDSTDWRSMFDREFLGAWDLGGKDVTVTIAKVEAQILVAQGNKKNKKPVIHFEGKEKGMVLNKTNSKIVAAMYGNDTVNWLGKRITLYPTLTTFGNESMECIRIRPLIPTGAAAAIERPNATA